jgi:hypothetical protein
MNKISAILSSICAALVAVMYIFFTGKRQAKKDIELEKAKEEVKIIEKLNTIDIETAIAGDNDIRTGMRDFVKKD